MYSQLHELALIAMTATPTPDAAPTLSKFERIMLGEIDAWELVGFLGIVLFSSRFIVQWIVSEIKKESVIPIAFWYLSIAGSLITLAYAIHIENRIFVLSYLFNSLIYFRNLYFIYAKKSRDIAGSS